MDFDAVNWNDSKEGYDFRNWFRCIFVRRESFPTLLGMMSKTLCDWSKKDIERHAAELLTIVTPQKFMCFKCVRTACDKHYLCRPESIEKIQRRAALTEHTEAVQNL